MTEHPPAKSSLLPGEFVNLGDAMLALAAARRLAREGREVVVLPYRRPADEVREEFEQAGAQVIGLRDEPWRALRACSSGSIWIGGGHAIRSEVSLGWLVFAVVVSWLARISGRQVRVVGAGATPVRPGWRRRLFGRVLAACDAICLRDPLSAQSVRADFPAQAGKVRVAGDLAFLDGGLAFPSGRMEPLTCLVSPGIDAGEGRIEDPAEILTELRALVERFGLQHVILVSHDARKALGLDFCRSLESEILKVLPVTVEVSAPGGVERGLLQPYGRARWIITGRLHGLIVGALLGRSVIYTRGSAGKLRPFAELFGYRPAGGQDDHRFHVASERIAPAIATQKAAAEANFS